MKKFLLLIQMALIATCAIAQDVIIKTNGDEIEAKVITVNDDQVTYQRWSNLQGPIYTILTKDIFMIKYVNGEKDMFGDKKTETSQSLYSTPEGNQVKTYEPQTYNTLNSNNLSSNNIDFLRRQQLLTQASRYKTWGWICAGLIFVGGGIGTHFIAWDGEEYDSTAVLIGSLTTGILTVLPIATLVTKGNSLESMAYKLNAQSCMPIKEYDFNGISIKPGLAMIPNMKDIALGVGVQFAF